MVHDADWSHAGLEGCQMDSYRRFRSGDAYFNANIVIINLNLTYEHATISLLSTIVMET